MIMPRTCCPTHADNCRFGFSHAWAGPYLLDGGRSVGGRVWSHPDDVMCSTCGGRCYGNRSTTVPVLYRVLVGDHSRPDVDTFKATLAEAQAVLAASAALEDEGEPARPTRIDVVPLDAFARAAREKVLALRGSHLGFYGPVTVLELSDEGILDEVVTYASRAVGFEPVEDDTVEALLHLAVERACLPPATLSEV